MRVIWEIEDGYVGKARPQYTEILEEDLEGCETEEEKRRAIEEIVEEDFWNHISWYIVRIEDD